VRALVPLFDSDTQLDAASIEDEIPAVDMVIFVSGFSSRFGGPRAHCHQVLNILLVI
jgi:hypothetical protein